MPGYSAVIRSHEHPEHVLTLEGDERHLVANCSCRQFGMAQQPPDGNQLANFWEYHLGVRRG